MEQASKRPRRRSILHDSCLNTSAYGLSRAARSKSLHNRLFWLISFLSFTGVMIYFIVQAMITYFRYPTKIDVAYANKWPQYFPAFSLCNLSPIRSDKMIGPLLNYSYTFNWTNTSGTPTIGDFKTDMIYSFIIDRMNRNESIYPFSYPLSSMLHTCTFNGQPCLPSDFILFTSSVYGLCYTFNAKMKNSSRDQLHTTGENAGEGKLSLGLYLHSHQYLPQLTSSVGLIALVHGNTQLPLIEGAGIELAPGRKHRLGYREKTVVFSPPPYSTCTNEVSVVMKAMFENYNGADYAYSEMICYELCFQTYVFDQCGCVNPSKWNARSIVLPGTNKIIIAPLCSTNNSCYPRAINAFAASVSIMSEYCSNCQTQCSIIDFIVQTSSSAAPVESQMNGIKAFVENSTVPLPSNWSSTWREEIYGNYLRVDVVCQTTIVETNIQSATLSPVDLLSNIGGQTGLWIGVSFLSVMELIEMLYRIIRHHFHARQVGVKNNEDMNVT